MAKDVNNHTFEVTIPMPLWHQMQADLIYSEQTLDEWVAGAIECFADSGANCMREDRLNDLANLLKPTLRGISNHQMPIDKNHLLQFFLNIMADSLWLDGSTKSQMKNALAEYLAHELKGQLDKQ